MDSRHPDLNDEIGELVTSSLRNKVAKQCPSETVWQRVKRSLQQDRRPKRWVGKERFTLSLIPLAVAGLMVVFGFSEMWGLNAEQADDPQLIASILSTQRPSQTGFLNNEIIVLPDEDQREIQQLKLLNRMGTQIVMPASLTNGQLPKDIIPHPPRQLKRNANRSAANPVNPTMTEFSWPALGDRQLIP